MRASRLAAALSDRHGLSPDAARKRVSRVSPPIKKLRVGLLPRSEAFLYHQDHRKSEWFWDCLLRDLRESGSIHGVAIDGLLARGGQAQLTSFNVVAGSPEAQKKQIPLSRVLENLKRAGIVDVVDAGQTGQCVRASPHVFPTPGANQFRARTVAEDVLMDGLREWVRNLGLASYNAIEIRNAERAPKFSTFHWDLSGPSYLLPLTSSGRKGPKPGFFVADVFCNGTLNLADIQYFLRKVKMTRAFKQVVPFLPVLLADRFTNEALRAGKQAGVMMATTRNLFGETVAQALVALIDVLSRAAAVAAGNPDRVVELFRDLKAIEGAAGNLRGALFEMIVGYLVREIDGNSIDIGEVVRDPMSGKLAEIDVRRIKERQECWFYECRARQPTARVSADEITKWIERLGRIHRHHRAEKRFQGCDFGFEIWTTGMFDDDALKLLKRERSRRKRVTVDWKDGPQVREYARRASCNAILDMLDEHYFKHPLSDLDEAARPDSESTRRRTFAAADVPF